LACSADKSDRAINHHGAKLRASVLDHLSFFVTLMSEHHSSCRSWRSAFACRKEPLTFRNVHTASNILRCGILCDVENVAGTPRLQSCNFDCRNRWRNACRQMNFSFVKVWCILITLPY